MPPKQSRRQFFRTSALAGAGLWAAGAPAFAQKKRSSDRLMIAVIGVSGRGGGNLQGVSDEEIVALCDVEESRAAVARKRFPDAKFYNDFRRLFDDRKLKFDAVVISTPDHNHAPAAMLALRAGKHVYCEKPLTHSVYEARTVAEMAAKKKRATQLGTQIHAEDNYRRVVELVQKGAIGSVDEVHVWVGKTWAGTDRPQDTPPVPPTLNWDAWLGPAPWRPYHPEYTEGGKWRGWWDFGSGTLGDMGCHYMDLPHWALDLRHPVTVEAEGPPVHPEAAPPWVIVRYEYPARKNMPAVKLTWYHGGKRPERFAEGKMPKWGDGVLFVGKKGMLLASYTQLVLLPEEQFKDFKRPDPYIPESIGHHAEWIEACKTGSPTTCNFDYSGALSETVLLGVVAYRCGKKIQWDAKRLRATNAPDAAQYVKRDYRKGWRL